MRRTLPMVALLLTSAVVVVALPTRGDAQFPGENGLIAYVRSMGTLSDRSAIRVIEPGWVDRRLVGGRVGGYRFTHAWGPAFSPDGERLAFTGRFDTRTGSAVGLFTIGVDGSEPHRFAGSGVNPAWSPDGTHIAYEKSLYDDRGEWIGKDIFVTDLETGASRRVGAPSPVAEPSWSPDGDLLAYRSGSSTIGVIDIDTGDRSTVLRLRRGSVVGFDWMPHGSHILFTRSRYVQRPGPTPSHDCYNAHHVVELLSLDGAREVLFRLPAYPGPYARPSVAPDGSMVVVEFLRDRPGDAACGGDDDLNEIGLIDLSDGTTARLVVDEDHHSQDPAWQPA